MKTNPCNDDLGFRTRNIFLIILHLVLFIRVKISGIGGNSWHALMTICIIGSIVFFIFDVLLTSTFYSAKIQHKLTFYMVFPALVSLIFYYLNEYNRAYNAIMINIIISIICFTMYNIFVVGIIVLHFHTKYTQKKEIICDICKQTYIIRAKEYRKHMDYVELKWDKTLDTKPLIICQKCLDNDPKFEKLSLAPDFTKINYKAKRLVEKRVTIEIDGEKCIPQVSDIEVDP